MGFRRSAPPSSLTLPMASCQPSVSCRPCLPISAWLISVTPTPVPRTSAPKAVASPAPPSAPPCCPGTSSCPPASRPTKSPSPWPCGLSPQRLLPPWHRSAVSGEPCSIHRQPLPISAPGIPGAFFMQRIGLVVWRLDPLGRSQGCGAGVGGPGPRARFGTGFRV